MLCVAHVHARLVFSASGWSTLVPDDSEVVGNMQAYVQHLLQSYSPTDEQPAHGGSLKTQPDQPQEAVSQAVRGWSPAQQALVGRGIVGRTAC